MKDIAPGDRASGGTPCPPFYVEREGDRGKDIHGLMGNDDWLGWLLKS